MKTKVFYTVILCLLAVLLTGSCKKEVVVSQELLTGTWKLDTHTQWKDMTYNIKDVVYEFQADGTLLVHSKNAYTDSYSYSLDSHKKTIELTYSEGGTRTWIIDKLSEEALVIHGTFREPGCSPQDVLNTLSFSRI